MTETATAAAATAGTEAQATATAASDGSTAASATDWASGLRDAGNREYVEKKGWKELDPLVTSARYADTLQSEIADLKSKALTPPAPDAKPEEWNAFYAKLGRPEKAEGYEFKLPQGLPENAPYDADFAKTYKQWAFEEGLPPRQAQGLHDRFVKLQAEAFTSQIEARAKEIATAENAATIALEKDWGDKSSEGFKKQVSLARRYIMNNGGEEKVKEWTSRGWLGPNGTVVDPAIAKAFAYAGQQYKEDSTTTGTAVPAKRSAAETLYPPENDAFATNRR